MIIVTLFVNWMNIVLVVEILPNLVCVSAMKNVL